ncbi:MAG: endonuclease III [Armatimonadetes bacterium]|nr:endonuclease III [Armatimonadota bacterium]
MTAPPHASRRDARAPRWTTTAATTAGKGAGAPSNDGGLPSCALVREVSAALMRAYGKPAPQRRSDPLDGLIGTILSQNTTSANSRAAFGELKRRFPTWEACRDARARDVIDAIRGAGLGAIRGPRIQEILGRIEEEQGRLSLDGLHDWPVRRGMAYLQSLPGVGPKTAACVLMFCCRKQVFPVDTHVARIARRLGWADEDASPEAIQALLEPRVPARLRYALHVNLIAHGRMCCHARRPGCGGCPIRAYCPMGVRGHDPNSMRLNWVMSPYS